jgi:PhzF family phenazine biosynthesis protein
MKEFDFKKIDAFATINSGGNPAGYVLLNSADDISVDEMQHMARELKGFVNEVGYVYRSSENQIDMKYYSSEREVDFCGHATVAIMYDLLINDTSLQQFETLKIKTNRGLLKAENRIKTENAVFIFSPEPFENETILTLIDIATNLNITPNLIDDRFPICIINAGLSTLLVPIVNLESILSISPGLKQLKDFCFANGIDIIHVFSSEVADKNSNYRTRVFAPTFGYIEDPATGSGNSAFGYYLLKNNLWKGETVSIEQNGLKNNFNVVKLQKQIDENGNTRILFGGAAIIRIEGKYQLH